MIAIVDYGAGNVQAFANIYKRLGIAHRIARASADLQEAQRIILPGVGSFDWVMHKLEASGMRPELERLVVHGGRPMLGVCVGMQILARRSDEGVLPGLGWIDAEVRRFDESRFQQRTRLPHMGWNDVLPTGGALFGGLVSPRFYFLHSYHFCPGAPEQTLATTDYNGVFTSAVHAGHIYGVQFHPEKSHQWGVQLLKNFAEI